MDAPAAEGVRVDWRDVPAPVRAAIESVCGARVVESTTQRGGFSPGLAARVRCADDARFFVKAVSSTANPDTPAMHRQEGANLRALDRPIRDGRVPAPRLVDTVEAHTWTALVLTDVEGRQPTLPWRTAELAQVLQTLDEMADSLTPAPITATGIIEELGDELTGWRTLAATPSLDGLDPWSRGHLDDLARLEADWERCAVGTTLLHTDVRAPTTSCSPNAARS